MRNRFTAWMETKADWVMRVIIVVSLMLGVVVAVQQRTLARCLATYNNEAAAWAERNQRAEDALWFAIDTSRSLPPAEARARSTAAFNEFVKARREAPPSPPSQRCD